LSEKAGRATRFIMMKDRGIIGSARAGMRRLEAGLHEAPRVVAGL